MITCSQCEKPAVMNMGGHPLCVDHAHRMGELIHTQQTELAAMLNFLLGQAEAVTGVSGLFPRLELPMPTISTGPTTFNNIRVDRSNVGVINTGEIEKLDVALTATRASGDAATAGTLQLLVQSVLDASDLGPDVKNEVLEHLAYLAHQATLPREKRQRSMGRTVVQALERLLHAAASVATVWGASKVALNALF